ncbi:hypothetical protein KP509_01G067200 [Ceratopteris richardii]|uniref:Uncharacterized protein n=1 Tax=Ceratopteris richardii TaxID=49495 RepID=A0A8T2VKK4_CERRI|nr:hypothetical protein KP509_01G067200 [Ceratopteris richardii]KAH7446654.1 hypothetical protein KP509_01G067200 [Ceratopteris richardii]
MVEKVFPCCDDKGQEGEMQGKGKSGTQLPGTTTLLVAILMTLILLLLTTGSNYLLEASFGFFARQLPLTPIGLLNNRTSEEASRLVPTVGAEYSKASQEDADSGRHINWLRMPPIFNYTQRYLDLIAQNGSKPCHDVATAEVQLFGLPKPEEADTYIKFKCGKIHSLTLVAFDALGRKRCAGGDYFEIDISGANWKSRAPVLDLQDGSYNILLQMHPAFAGIYRFRIVLGFSNYHGLHRRPERWFRNVTVLDMHLQFVQEEESKDSITRLPNLTQCSSEDFRLDGWIGRWVRTKYNASCSVDQMGRFRCLDSNARCTEPWCQGPIGALESNGWVYSAHCAFRIFTDHDAWKCLNRKWIFFWGDSNHVDSVRNFLNFVLGFENITEVPRRFDTTYYRPGDPSQYVRITSMFNGHSNASLNHEGLFSLHDEAFREQVAAFFKGKPVPDAIILNSGLHDGVYWKHLHQFAEEGAGKAVQFWASLLDGIQGKRPRVVYRTTITTAAWARGAPFNPQKMEIFNNILVEKFREANLLWGVVDGFDLTYPWHFDNNCSDGVHYGKPPAASRWYGQWGHQYFVDLMLVHILMHALCVS